MKSRKKILAALIVLSAVLAPAGTFAESKFQCNKKARDLRTADLNACKAKSGAQRKSCEVDAAKRFEKTSAACK